MSLTFAGGSIGIVVKKTVGTVHTTTVHIIPMWLIITVLAAIILPIWMARRGSRNSEKDTA